MCHHFASPTFRGVFSLMDNEDPGFECDDSDALKRTSGLFIMKTRDGRKLTQV